MIKTKAPTTVEELGEQYCLMGPYNESCVRTEVEILEPHNSVFKESIQAMRDAGIKVSIAVFTRTLHITCPPKKPSMSVLIAIHKEGVVSK